MPSPLALLSRAVDTVIDGVRSRFRGDSSGPSSGAIALGAVVLVTLATVGGTLALGVVFDATIDRTVTVDNPDRPPESTCEAFGDDDDSLVADRCDRPERIDVDVGSELRDATTGYVHYGLLGVPIWWVAFALVLHAGARLAGGAGSVADSFAIAGWAIGPELLRLVAGVAAIWYALATTPIEGTAARAIGDEITAAMATMQAPLLAVSAVVIALQWAIVTGGLEAVHDLDRETAATVSGLFAVVAFLLAAV